MVALLAHEGGPDRYRATLGLWSNPRVTAGEPRHDIMSGVTPKQRNFYDRLWRFTRALMRRGLLTEQERERMLAELLERLNEQERALDGRTRQGKARKR